MQNPDSQKVVKRFFRALSVLINRKKLRGRKTFTDRYGINRRALYRLEKELSYGIFQVSWLTYLVEDYGVSAEFLLTGKGKILSEE